MARTLSHIVNPSAPKTTRHDPQEETLAVMWGAIADLFRLGPEHRKLTTGRATLKRQLEDPAMRDHPKRPAAMERYVKWAIDLKSMEKRVSVAMIAFCAQFAALSDWNRQKLLSGAHWPPIQDAEVLSHELWRMAQAEDAVVAGEPPF